MLQPWPTLASSMMPRKHSLLTYTAAPFVHTCVWPNSILFSPLSLPLGLLPRRPVAQQRRRERRGRNERRVLPSPDRRPPPRVAVHPRSHISSPAIAAPEPAQHVPPVPEEEGVQHLEPHPAPERRPADGDGAQYQHRQRKEHAAQPNDAQQRRLDVVRLRVEHSKLAEPAPVGGELLVPDEVGQVAVLLAPLLVEPVRILSRRSECKNRGYIYVSGG